MSVSSINQITDGIILASSSSSLSTILSLLNPLLINNTIHIVLAFSSFFSVSVSLFSLPLSWPRTRPNQHGPNSLEATIGRASSTLSTSTFENSSFAPATSYKPPTMPSTTTKSPSTVVQAATGSPLSSKRSCSRTLPITKFTSFSMAPHMSASQKPFSSTPSHVSLGTSSPTGSATSPSPPTRSPQPPAAVRSTSCGGGPRGIMSGSMCLLLPPVSARALLSAETIKEIISSNNDDEDENEEMPKVMHGWLTIYTSDNPNSPFSKTSARTQVLKKVNELLKLYKDENPSVVISGHSLGASLSILSAYDLVENGVKNVRVTAIVFGSPQVGNKAFNERVKKFTNLKVLHIRNVIDLITLYPGGLLGYVDTSGTELRIDTRKSPSLKESKNPSDWHNLQAMLHVVAGWNGADGEFEMKVKRSVALVNKSCEFLKDEYLVPGSWWVEKNKSMVRRDDGEWVLTSPDDEDLPVPED